MTTRILTALCLATALLVAGTIAAADAPQGLTAGVTVHGHWKIEVFDPDGTLVSSVEFDNAFVGGTILANFMARSKTVGFWSVNLADSTGGGPCRDGGNITPLSCSIVEPGEPQVQSFVFNTLQVTPVGAALQLSGSFQAPEGGTLEVVKAGVDSCPPTTPPSTSCFGLDTGTFTQTTLATPVAVQSGQTVEATVTITFS